MQIPILLAAIFITIFGLLFIYLRKHFKEDGFVSLVLGATIFSALLTALFAVVLFFIFGSTKVMDSLLSLQITSKQLMWTSILFFIYHVTIHSVVELVFEVVFGKNSYVIVCAAAVRIGAFYIIAMLLQLPQTANLTLAISISALLFLLEVVIFTKDKREAVQ